jgi:hypothetical protein
MSFYSVGNKPINSTGFSVVAAPSTSSLIAELDSTRLGTKDLVTGQHRLCVVHWIVGADVDVTWQLETCGSTALNSGKDIIFPKTAQGISNQYMTRHELGPNDRIRARMASTGANASAFISAEMLI